MKTWTFIFVTLTMLLLAAHVTAKPPKGYDDYRERCAEIRDDVENWLTAEGITPDYFYLLVAESHCKDKTSKAGAVGYWQMLPATARKYGCDSPHDLECETRAAARYLHRLEEKCGVENVIYCWHDGGSNFLRRGKKPSQGAKGLLWQYRHLMRTDVPEEYTETKRVKCWCPIDDIEAELDREEERRACLAQYLLEEYTGGANESRRTD